ncbi:hypothetical protein D0Z00_001375 [Geotrichum galactomycetum]|uniref:Uncharacterized protein n=1 Tax=Geotrichum galactomycetum TaxID=27317 RepID=A0ACB6V7A3_9ASCO|nr:hypothetical protein D0Z00_001375 [Geotrichum candidum]
MMMGHLNNLTYPHELIDLAFLVSDSDDSTEVDLELGLRAALEDDKFTRFHSIEIFEKDFGAIIGQGFDDRHGVAVQGVRRKLMGRARNWLTSVSLKPYHSWVYWRDADIETSPTTIIEDLMKHDRDVIVPNVWRPLPDWLGSEQPYDLNSWQESEPGLELAKSLNEDDVIVEGYAEYTTWRPHLAYFRNVNGDPNEMYDLDGIGGVSILAKAHVFRHGALFPGFAFENHAETEGFGKMARRMGFTVSGLPNYTIWHLYEPSEDDLKKMKEMEDSKGDKEDNPSIVAKAPDAVINDRFEETAVKEEDLELVSQAEADPLVVEEESPAGQKIVNKAESLASETKKPETAAAAKQPEVAGAHAVKQPEPTAAPAAAAAGNAANKQAEKKPAPGGKQKPVEQVSAPAAAAAAAAAAVVADESKPDSNDDDKKQTHHVAPIAGPDTSLDKEIQPPTAKPQKGQ